jgi:50S ribosomal protein L16 3-hydroxylase
VPPALQRFAERAVASALRDPRALQRALGEVLSEPKPRVWFDAGAPLPRGSGAKLDARTRVLYDERHLFINGESCRIGGRDARLLRLLADQRTLAAGDVGRLSFQAANEVDRWAAAGWVHAVSPT